MDDHRGNGTSVGQLAAQIAASIAEHQSRGLVDAAPGLDDVVIHGRADLLAVAEDVLFGWLADRQPARRSWAPWFLREVGARRRAMRREAARERLVEQAESGGTPAEAALARLRLREL